MEIVQFSAHFAPLYNVHLKKNKLASHSMLQLLQSSCDMKTGKQVPLCDGKSSRGKQSLHADQTFITYIWEGPDGGKRHNLFWGPWSFYLEKEEIQLKDLSGCLIFYGS